MNSIELFMIFCAAITLAGFLVSWSRYRAFGALLQSYGLGFIAAAALYLVTNETRMQIRTETFLVLQLIWIECGAGALLLMRLSGDGWNALLRAFRSGSEVPSNDDIGRTVQALSKARSAMWTTGTLFFLAANIAALIGMPVSARLHHLSHVAGVLMPLLIAPLTAEFVFAQREQAWRQRLPTEHPDRYVASSVPSRIWALVYGGIWLFTWALFVSSGIPARWIP